MEKTIYSQINRDLREWLIVRRKERGLSMREVGEHLGVPHSWVGKTEQGERRLDLVEFLRYCRILEADPCEIIRKLQTQMDAESNPTRNTG